ncbi:MAG: hypothetical protein FLDDKLPJ_03516 [Phycisphaerae bacterium]|nr:hypothetical protein [Phycisphaerae bacterium]
MDLPVAAQAHQVDAAAGLTGVLEGADEHGVPEEGSVFDAPGDAHNLLLDDPPGTDVLMPDLAVAHRAVGQTDVAPAGLDERVRIGPHEAVVHGFAGEVDGVGVVPLGVGVGAPAVADDEDDGAKPVRRHATLQTGEPSRRESVLTCGAERVTPTWRAGRAGLAATGGSVS